MSDEKLINKIDDAIRVNENRLVSCLWNNSDFYFEIDGLVYDDFIDNTWGTIFYIGYDLICNNNVKVITEQEVHVYLKQHKKISKVWNSLETPESSAYANIMNVVSHVTPDNFQYYYDQFKKYKAIKNLIKQNILTVTEDSLNDIMEMTADELYNDYEVKLNYTFTSTSSQGKANNLYDNIQNNMLSWFKGEAMGAPIMFMPEFSKFFGGIPTSDVSLIGGISNAGKSSLLRNAVIPIFFLTDEESNYVKKNTNINSESETIKDKDLREKIENKRTVVFLNEEEVSKWQREMLVWIARNEFGDKTITKNLIRDGGIQNTTFEKWKEKIKANEIIEWMQSHIPDKHILFMGLPKFSTKLVIKYIKKYSAMGYKNFVIDTFKMDNTDDSKIDNNTRLQLVQNMTHLYNVAKKQGGKNVRVICTVQLAKSQTLTRYLSQEALAESKNMIDPCACGIFLRKVWEDEKQGGNKEFKVHSFYNPTNVFTLDICKNYLILFPVKTREGDLSRQCICEVDWGTNFIKEVGFVTLQPDN